MQSPEGPAGIEQFILPEFPSVCGHCVFMAALNRFKSAIEHVWTEETAKHGGESL